jgi:hypothetical protein
METTGQEQEVELSYAEKARQWADRYPQTCLRMTRLIQVMEKHRGLGAEDTEPRAAIREWLYGERGNDLTALFERSNNPFSLFSGMRGWRGATRELALALRSLVRAMGQDGMAPGRAEDLVCHWL